MNGRDQVADEKKTVLGSLARITDFGDSMPDFEARPRDTWRRGDYVAVEVLPGELDSYPVETPDGSLQDALPGDLIIGALGTRAATLQVTGSWEEVGEDLEMHTLTRAGVLGKRTSAAIDSDPVVEVAYRGHLVRDGSALNMEDFVRPAEQRELEAPVILIIGTSMDSGKTVTGVAMVRELVAMGKRVVATKVTGVGRLKDTLAMKEAGAAAICDFVDVGLPSSVVPREEYAGALELLLSKIAAEEPDVVVLEAGASPLEPYRGDVAMEVLQDKVAFTVLCASDPYAVLGVMQALDMTPDLVTGRCTATRAGIDLIEKLVGVPAINVLDPEIADRQIDDFLVEHLPGLAD